MKLRLSRFSPLFLASLLGLAAAACSASANEQGGDPRFTTTTSVSDGGVCSGTEADAGSGTGWTDLYRDFFGPTGKASCTFAGNCHGDSSQAGAQQSGYVCGADVATCFSGITSAGAGLVIGGTDDPTTTSLYQVLRKCSGGGSMPQSPSSVYLSNADMARIATWLKAGAPND